MEEDDHDELLQCTDDESLSDNEDQCMPVEKPEENYRHISNYVTHTKMEFLATKVGLVIVTLALLILLPLYLESINVRGNVYSMIFTNTSLSAFIFVVSMAIVKFYTEDFKFFSFPIKFTRIIILSTVYFICATTIIHSLDRKRVLCHLQDPIKGIVLVFALLYYFFFCKKIMGLQRIFSATTIIVGLFIAVDYGLCDEFRCRGYERQRIADDAGHWNWQTHSAWTSIYLYGLAMFAAYFTLLDRYLLFNFNWEFPTITTPSFLNTVSRVVSQPHSKPLPSQIAANNQQMEVLNRVKKHNVLHLAMWIHLFGLLIIIGMFWADLIPQFGKGTDAAEYFNDTTNGILCHFEITNPKSNTCGNVFLFSWLFLFFYVLFVLLSLKFLILSQSTVYTIATMTTALPFLGVWWSLFHFQPDAVVIISWSPSVTGEMICSLLGIPIVFIGLYLLCKAHFKDYQWSRVANTQVMTPNQFA